MLHIKYWRMSDSRPPTLPQAGQLMRAGPQVRDMTGTGEVTKRRVREGRGEFPVDCPLDDCAVRVHFRVRRPDTSQVQIARQHGHAASVALP